MSVFIFFFFSIYGACNLYIFVKTKSALHPGPVAGLILALFLALMTASPVIIKLLETSGHQKLAIITAHFGFFWLGILFLFVSASFLVDIYRLLLYTLESLLKRDYSAYSIPAVHALLVPLGIAILASLFGYFEAKQIRTEHVLIRTSKIPESVRRLRIVQISDIHLGLIVREERLKRILEEVEKAVPDLLVSTGDLVDAQICDTRHFSELLKKINPRYGKFAITGNHEFYAGLNQALECTREGGFKVLRGEAVNIGGFLNVAGVDDPAGRSFGVPASSEKEVLSPLPPASFTILLKHRPLVSPESFGLFDLQLSGHTHKGQIFPFSLITMFYYPLHAGLMEFGNGSHLYISRGAGTWGPPIRFLAPPEITVIDLVREPER